MNETQIINNYAIEREQLTLNFVLAIVDLYSHDVEKIKEKVQELIDKNNERLSKEG